MSKIDIYQVLNSMIVKTQVAQQTDDLYAQLQPLSQTVSNQNSQIRNSADIQNAARLLKLWGILWYG